MNRQGFTLLELIIVTVILGLLAAFGIQGYGKIKERTYVTAMKADLSSFYGGAQTHAETTKAAVRAGQPAAAALGRYRRRSSRTPY